MMVQFGPATGSLDWVPQVDAASQIANLDFKVDTWGKTIPLTIGNIRIAGSLIWGLKPTGTKCSFAVSFGYRLDPTRAAPTLNRMWANGNLIYDGTVSPPSSLAGLAVTFYPGSETQGIDPTIQADRGTLTPAYRGQMYVVFNQLDLTTFNNMVPFITAEILDNPGGRVYVRDVIIAVAKQSGYTDDQIFVSNVPEFPDQCDGCILTADTTFQDFVTSLAEPYNLQIVDGDQIQVIRRAYGDNLVIDATIQDTELVTEEQGDDVLRWDLQEQTEIPFRCEVSYIDANTNYQTANQIAQQPLFPEKSTTSRQVRSLSLPLIVTASEALNLAYGALYRATLAQEALSFKTMPKRLGLQPGDVVAIGNGADQYVARIMTQSISPNFSSDITAQMLLANVNFNFVVPDPTLPTGTGGSAYNPTQYFDPMMGNGGGGSSGDGVQFGTD
jgi:hypothetical protein